MRIIDDIDSTFVGTIKIVSEDVLAEENLLDIIDETQEEYLRKLLGDSFYFESLQDEDLLTELINGVGNYTYNKKTYRFEGVKKMLAQFSYWNWCNHIRTQMTSSGHIAMNNQNSEAILDTGKMMKAYNKGVDLYNEAVFFMQSREDATYDDVISTKIHKTYDF